MTQQFGVRNKATKKPWIRADSYADAEAMFNRLEFPDAHEIVSRAKPQPNLWKEAKKPIDYSASREEIETKDHIAGRVIDGYVIHAFRLDDKFRESIIAGGFNTYYGRSSTQTGLAPMCGKLKPYHWARRVVTVRDDITSLEDEAYESYDKKLIHTVCVSCQNSVRQMRQLELSE